MAAQDANQQPRTDSSEATDDSSKGSTEASTEESPDATAKPLSQTARRTTYGLNVLIAVTAMVGIVILINWFAYRQFHRFDFTATRQYSLSEQTRQVLRSLDEPYEVITLLGSDPRTANTAAQVAIDERMTRARDLVNEYARTSTSIRGDHIDPDVEVARLRALYGRLAERFANVLAPARTATTRGMEELDRLSEQIAVEVAHLDDTLGGPNFTDARQRQTVEQVRGTLQRIGEQLASTNTTLERNLETPLPDYNGILVELENTLARWSGVWQPQIVSQLDQLTRAGRVPDHVADALLTMTDRLERSRRSTEEIIAAMSGIAVPQAYTRLLTDSATVRDAVLVLGPEGSTQARFVALTEMFTVGEQATQFEGQRAESAFRGEELLTAAIISLRMPVQPLAVFAYTGQQSATGQDGQFRALAERLRAANFEVVQWNPMGHRGSSGAPEPPGPPPRPAPNQPVVWIFPPLIKPQPNNPMPTGSDRVAQLARDRMDAGDGVLLMLQFDPSARFGSMDPMVEILDIWGIEARISELILHEVPRGEDTYETMSPLLIERWPTNLAITRALTGLPGFVYAASPLTFRHAESDGLQHWPLIEMRERRQWAEANFGGDRMPTYDPARSRDVFVAGAAAEYEDGRRLVVISDPVFATDHLTTMGQLGPGTAQLTGSVFPANAELMVNSVTWLAGLDDLIAATARTQDIRRVRAVEPQTMRGLMIAMYAGLPALTVIVGMGVWYVRRRG